MSCCSSIELFFFEIRPLSCRRASFELDQVALRAAMDYFERTRSRSRRNALHGDKIAFFAERALRYVAPGPLHHDFPDGFGLRQDRRFRDAEVFPAFFQVVSFAAVGEKAVIADAHQAFGKRVKEKSSDEFHRVDGHGLDGSLLAVFVREGDLSVGKIEDPAVGDRDPVRVAADVVDDAVGVVERRFHVDDPCLGPQDVFQLSETVRGCIFGRVSGECEFGFVVRLLQVEHELAPEDLRQGAFRKKPVVFAGDPVLAVRGQRSRGNDDMDVEMVRKRLVPGMKKGHEAEFAAESVVRVRAELQQGFRHGFEQNVDCDFPVAENNRIQIVRDGEHVVEIFDRQHLALSLFKPAFLGHGLAFGTMAVAAGIVERDFLSAIGAFLNAASEPFRAAADYVRDHLELGGRHLVDLKVVAYMLAEYVGDFEF